MTRKGGWDSDNRRIGILNGAAQKADPRLLEVQPEPIYKLPPALDKSRRFVFSPDVIDEEQGLRLIEEQGAWKTNGFQALLEPPPPPSQITLVVTPRPGHTALVLAAGVADGAVIDTADYGTVAIRGKTQHVEAVARVEVESDPKDPDRKQPTPSRHIPLADTRRHWRKDCLTCWTKSTDWRRRMSGLPVYGWKRRTRRLSRCTSGSAMKSRTAYL